MEGGQAAQQNDAETRQGARYVGGTTFLLLAPLMADSSSKRPAPDRRNPKAVGEHSEGMVLAALLRAGEQVAVPFGDNQRYDFLVDRGGRFLRIQVKTGRRVIRGASAGTIVFPTCSSQAHRGRPSLPYRGQVDFFAVYCPETDAVYFVPVDECGRWKACLRLDPPRKQQHRVRMRWARDHVRLP
jgi:hypothetical protein